MLALLWAAVRKFFSKLPTTLKEIDGVSFFQRVTSLVNIDNAIRSSQTNYSSRANVASSSSRANQVDPQVLMKALEECNKEIKISANRTKELDSTSSTLQQFIYQVLGFFLVFQGAMIAVAFNQTSFSGGGLLLLIPFLSVAVGVICTIANVGNAVGAVSQKRRMEIEKCRLQIYARYKRKLHEEGVDFNFLLNPEISIRSVKRSRGRLMLFSSQNVFILTYMVLVLVLTVVYEYKLVLLRQSTLADSAAPAPAPGVESVQSGKTWCVAKAGSPDMDLMNGLNFSCGEGGADCGPIQPGGACFSPDTIVSHASVAYNTYYQNMGRNPWNCYFGGTSVITITDPSYLGCRFL